MSRRRRVRDHQPEVGDIRANNIPRNIPGDRPCPGPCNRQWRAAEAAAATERKQAEEQQRPPDRRILEHTVKLWPGRPYWCVDVPRFDAITGQALDGRPDHHGCTEQIRQDLRAIPDLAAQLTPGQLNTPRDVSEQMGHSTTIDQPTNSPAWDDLEAVIRWAVGLEDQVRAKYGHGSGAVMRSLTASSRGARRVIGKQEMPRLLGHAIAYLARELDRILRDEQLAVTVGQQILARKRSLEQDTGTGRLVHRLPGLCMACGRKGLRRTDGTELVKCGSCGACWDWDHYQILARGYGVMVRGDGT